MDPSLGPVPENAGMITFDPPYLQYWPNPSTAYGAASGFVILLLLVTGAAIVRKNLLYIPMMAACIAASTSLFVRGFILFKPVHDVDLFRLSIIFEYISFFLMLHQVYSYFSKWALYVGKSERLSKISKYISYYSLLSNVPLSCVGVSTVFNSSAIIRGSGFCVIISSLTNSLLAVLSVAAIIFYLISVEEIEYTLNQIVSMILPSTLLFLWLISRYIFWTKNQSHPLNSNEKLYYIMGHLMVGAINLYWLAMNTPATFSDEMLSGEKQNPDQPSLVFSKDLHIEPIGFPERVHHLPLIGTSTDSYATEQSRRKKRSSKKSLIFAHTRRGYE